MYNTSLKNIPKNNLLLDEIKINKETEYVFSCKDILEFCIPEEVDFIYTEFAYREGIRKFYEKANKQMIYKYEYIIDVINEKIKDKKYVIFTNKLAKIYNPCRYIKNIVINENMFMFTNINEIKDCETNIDILKILNQIASNKVILDFACGYGILLRYVDSARKIYLNDINQNCIDYLKKIIQNENKH